MFQVSKNSIVLHPAASGCVALKFTAPVDGVYSINGLWGGARMSLSPNSVLVSIRKKTETRGDEYLMDPTPWKMLSGNSAPMNITFSKSTNLAKGERIYFIVEKNSSYWRGDTILEVNIQGPDPKSDRPVPSRR